MNNKSLFEYLKIIFAMLLVALVSVIIFLVVIQQQVYQELSTKRADDDTIDYYLIGVLIEKNKYLETKNPENYKINLKLAILYEISKDWASSEKEYEIAIEKEPYNEFRPQYRLAYLYTKLNRLEDAQATMDKIKDKPDKKLIKYKALIYEKLGDKYYNLGDYEQAIEKYQKASNYFSIIKNKTELASLRDSLASAYVYLAEYYLSTMRVDDAISSLRKALSLVNAPILKYKLALLLMSDHPNEAYTYFEQVFDQEPSIINYKQYNRFLTVLAKEADDEGNFPQADLYRFEIKRLNDYFENNILSVKDISVLQASGRVKTNYWKNKDNIDLEFKIKNTSPNDIGSLYMDIVFKEDGKKINEYYNQFIDSKTVLKAGETSPIFAVKSYKKIINRRDIDGEIDKIEGKTQPSKKSRKEMTAEIYISKTQKSYKILLTTINIERQSVKKKKISKFVKQSRLFIKKIMSKLPAFLY